MQWQQYFDLCSLKDNTFEKLTMIKSNHHKSVNDLKKNSWLTEQKLKVPDNFHFTVLYNTILLMLIIYKVLQFYTKTSK